MLRKYFLMMLLTFTALAHAYPVYAQAVSIVYVDTSYAGSEDGTQSRPYNTLAEGIAFARSLPNGAYVYVKEAGGVWNLYAYFAPTFSGPMGGEGGPTFSDSTATYAVAEATITSTVIAPASKTPTSLLSGETATALPSVTATSPASEVTATAEIAVTPEATATLPLPSPATGVPAGILYVIIALLALVLIFVVAYYQQRLRGP